MKYIIVVDKQSRTNPSSQKKEVVIEIDELRRKGDVHDDLIIEKSIAKVIRRVGITKFNVTYLLGTAATEEIGEVKIPLFQGDNYIYVKDSSNNPISLEYILKNDFTDMYVTDLQMSSAIEQTSSKILLDVYQRLEGYSDREETEAKIELRANQITEAVSRTYATKDALEEEKSARIQTANEITQSVSSLKKSVEDNYDTSEEVNSKIEQKASSITSSVSSQITTAKTEAINSANSSTDNKLKNYSTTTQMNSEITQKANELKSIISASITSPNLLLNSDFSNSLENWNIIESTTGSARVATINSKSWLQILNSETGSYNCKLRQTVKPFANNMNYTISLLAQATHIDDIEPYIMFKFMFYDDSNTCIQTQSEVVTLELTTEQQKVFTTITAPNNNIAYCILSVEVFPPFTNINVTNLQLEKGSVATDWNISQTEFYSMINQKVDEISMEVSKKVNNDDFSTKLSMDYASVQIAWNKISEFIQFVNAKLQIKDSDKKLLMSLDKNGQNFYHNSSYVGKIGSSQYKYDNTQKGLVFNLDENGKFMGWGVISSDKESYITKLWYNIANSFSKTREGVYLGTNLELNGHKIVGDVVEVSEGKEYDSDGGTYYTLDIDDNISYIATFSRMTCSFNGDVYSDGYKVLTNASDGRLKKNIYTSAINALDIINQIKHRQFDWKKDDTHQSIGYIAQEIEKIDSNYVQKNPQCDEDGNIIDYTYQINLLPILATATKAIQEMDVKLNEQQKTIDKQQQFIELLVEKLDMQEEYDNIFNTAAPKKARARKEKEVIFEGDIQHTRRRKQNRKHKVIKEYKNGEAEIVEEEEVE